MGPGRAAGWSLWGKGRNRLRAVGLVGGAGKGPQEEEEDRMRGLPAAVRPEKLLHHLSLLRAWLRGFTVFLHTAFALS